MRPSDFDHLPTVYLKPAEISICVSPAKVVTVLGSCVSVVFFNRRLGIGAICHATLPGCHGSRRRKDCEGFCDEAFKFTDCSIRYMLKVFGQHGSSNSEIEVKLFGGADTLASKRENTIGSQNVKIALEVISGEKLKVIAADVGDSFGRKLIFISNTGDVFVKRLKNAMKYKDPA